MLLNDMIHQVKTEKNDDKIETKRALSKQSINHSAKSKYKSHITPR